MEWFLDVVKNKYLQFNGRARRKEYWMYVLFYVIIMVVAGIIDMLIGMNIIGGLLSLALLLPTIGVSIRRLHDVGKSGWFLLLGFIPLVNFYLLYLLVTEGEHGDNQYGPDPKANEVM